MWTARAAVTVSVDGTVSRTELDERRERTKVDAAGEGEMAAGVVELCTSLWRVCSQHWYCVLMTGNQCRNLSNDWDELRYGELHTSLAREFCTLCRLLKVLRHAI